MFIDIEGLEPSRSTTGAVCIAQDTIPFGIPNLVMFPPTNGRLFFLKISTALVAASQGSHSLNSLGV